MMSILRSLMPVTRYRVYLHSVTGLKLLYADYPEQARAEAIESGRDYFYRLFPEQIEVMQETRIAGVLIKSTQIRAWWYMLDYETGGGGEAANE